MKIHVVISLFFFLIYTYGSFADIVSTNLQNIPDGKGETYISGFTFVNQKVTYEIYGEEAIIGGDIILGTVEEMEEIKAIYENNDTNISNSFVILGEGKRWIDAVFPYVMNSDIPNAKRRILYDAFREWERYTSLRFIPATQNQISSGKIYIRITNRGDCSAVTGMRFRGQSLNIGGCSRKGDILHELGHVAGLYHEHQRYDRDQYITIYPENMSSMYLNQLTPFGNVDNILGPYNYASVMHYASTDGSNVYDYNTNRWKPVMLAKNGAKLGNLNLTQGDIDAVNKIYAKPASMLFPINGVQLNSTSVLFRWTNTFQSEIYLKIINSHNAILYQGYQNTQSKRVNNLPSDGSTIHVTLETNTVDGWETKNYTYAAYLAEPLNPSNSVISDILWDSVTLRWQDNTSTEQGYKIYKGSTLIATLPANSTSYKLENLEDDTSYIYTIKAFNNGGESAGLVVTFKTDKNRAWMIPAIYHPILLAQ